MKKHRGKKIIPTPKNNKFNNPDYARAVCFRIKSSWYKGTISKYIKDKIKQENEEDV